MQPPTLAPLSTAGTPNYQPSGELVNRSKVTIGKKDASQPDVRGYAHNEVMVAPVSRGRSLWLAEVLPSPDLIGDLDTLAAAHELRIPIAIEGKTVLHQNLAPVGERRIGSDPEVVDAVNHEGAQLKQSSAQLTWRHVLKAERRQKHLDDVLLELGTMLVGVRNCAATQTAAQGLGPSSSFLHAPPGAHRSSRTDTPQSRW